jgi:hypothetical protein
VEQREAALAAYSAEHERWGERYDELRRAISKLASGHNDAAAAEAVDDAESAELLEPDVDDSELDYADASPDHE